MLRPTAKEVYPLSDYKLFLTFDNGEKRVFDVKPYLTGAWFCELKDISYFKSVDVDDFTVVWPHGQDLCPDDLYYLSVDEKAGKGV